MESVIITTEELKQDNPIFLTQQKLKQLELDSFNFFITNFQYISKQKLELLGQNQFNRLLKVVKTIKPNIQNMYCWIKKIQSYQNQLIKTIQNTKLLNKINKIFNNREQYDRQLKSMISQMARQNQNNKFVQGHKTILSALSNIQVQISNANSKKSLCCTKSFYLHQIINQVENDQYQFKNFQLPLRDDHIYTLKRTICGFLNWMGGYIYIGIKQFENLKMVVRGVNINAKDRQRFLWDIKKITASIHPTLYIAKKYFVDFIPVINTNKQMYVIKITVKPGQRSSVYSIKVNEFNQIQYWKRNGPEVIKISNYQLQKQIIRRYQSPLQSPIQHICVQPQNFVKSNALTFNSENDNQQIKTNKPKLNDSKKNNRHKNKKKKIPILVTSDHDELEQFQQFNASVLKNSNLLFDLANQK